MLVTIVYHWLEYSRILYRYCVYIIIYNKIRQRKTILMSDNKKKTFITLYCLYA